MTLADMLDLVRLDLKELDSGAYRWTDDELERAIARAVAEYSRHAPLQVKTELATVADSPDIDISSLTGRVSVDRVEFPQGNRPRTFVRFELYGDTITLLETLGDGEDCYVYWTQVHELGVATSTIPAKHEDLIALGASAFAVLSQSQYAVNLVGSGGEHVDRDYMYWARNRLAEFQNGCKKAGAKLKQGTLYVDT
jgi:hypothetical protein